MEMTDQDVFICDEKINCDHCDDIIVEGAMMREASLSGASQKYAYYCDKCGWEL
jgi:RNase P subunit RPR2